MLIPVISKRLRYCSSLNQLTRVYWPPKISACELWWLRRSETLPGNRFEIPLELFVQIIFLGTILLSVLLPLLPGRLGFKGAYDRCELLLKYLLSVSLSLRGRDLIWLLMLQHNAAETLYQWLWSFKIYKPLLRGAGIRLAPPKEFRWLNWPRTRTGRCGS